MARRCRPQGHRRRRGSGRWRGLGAAPRARGDDGRGVERPQPRGVACPEGTGRRLLRPRRGVARARRRPPPARAPSDARGGRVVYGRAPRTPAHERPRVVRVLRAWRARLLEPGEGAAPRGAGGHPARPRRCERAGTPCGLAITGVAGPDGGTAAKPVGTVFVALAVASEVTSRRFRFLGDRASVKWQSTQAAFDMLRRALKGRT